MRLGIIVGMFPPAMYPGAPEITLADIVRLAQQAEGLGVEMVCMPEAPVYREAVVPLAAMAGATSSVQLASCILPIGYRSPVIVARAIAQLDELSGGRAMLGLGIGHQRVLAGQGIATDAPVQRLREYIDIVRSLLTGESVDYQGRFYAVQGTSLGFTPLRPDVPIYLGSTGQKSIQLAGELADGVFLPALCVEGWLDKAYEHLSTGAAKAGRTLEDLTIARFNVTAVHPDPEVARAAARRLLIYYLASPHYDTMITDLGFLDGALKLRQDLAEEGPEAAARCLTDDMVTTFAVTGTAEQCAGRLEQFGRRGIQLHTLLPVGLTPQEAIGGVLNLCQRAK